jgi:thiol-disulfide isomerase/thioredoxin
MRIAMSCVVVGVTVFVCALLGPGGLGGMGSVIAAPTQSRALNSLFAPHRRLNGSAPRLRDVRGKAVLVNLWTFSCINCLQMLPHVRAWAERYKDQSLVVVGVQTPEFAFEKDVNNSGKAVPVLGVPHPVAVDNDFRIWRDFGNDARPAVYCFGADGAIRRRVAGEAQYDEPERRIQQLLSEADGARAATGASPTSATGPEAPADLGDLDWPETYIGYAQSRGFDSQQPVRANDPKLCSSADSLPLNHGAPTGRWTVGAECAALTGATGSIRYRFHARDVHLVLANSTAARRIRFRITIDGASPGVSRGADVDAEGRGVLDQDRLYQLVRQAGAIVDHTIEIDLLTSGVCAYAFTFG